MRETRANIANALYDLMLRGMLTRKSKVGYKTGYVYSTLHTDKDFELRPRAKKVTKLKVGEAKALKDFVATLPDESKASAVEKPKVLDAFDTALAKFPENSKLDVTRLPLQEAHEVYLQLKSYFEPKVL
jgi:hypothetical protein